MERAYTLAVRAKHLNEVPVGAVIVSENNQLIGEGFNQSITLNDPCAHAEVMAIRSACEHIQNYRLPNTTMYVTLEPCPMCAGALIQARVKRVVFATRDVERGACGSLMNIPGHQQLNHKLIMDEGIMQQECSALLRDFFAHRR